MDPNDEIFPIAYAMVEGENKESWSWFLALLKHDLGIDVVSENEYIFISDKQKGLLPAFSVVLPNVVLRFCVRHLYANMKAAGFHGNAIKDTLWAAARDTTVNCFKESMRKMKELDNLAFGWLGDKHPSEWSRSHFTTSALCDILVNNMCECFNAMIVKARETPLISCLESLRTLLMTRLFKNKQDADEWTGIVCPNIVKKIALEEKFAGGFIPLQHAICAIWMKRHNVLEYVDSCYNVETYLKVYGCGINAMAGPNEWPHTHREAPLPPEYKAKPDRPRKLRLRGADEKK
ncbi:PREDICTED: uncharacterized protein LOC109166969 [Ipomoea nil]|uniref:uncharacterized protein LOC109166969 n=1 Tax=Ipomoea nil TaxID=35883 RepID=UPI0009017C71|nr:PREDICTED: uncharacterized protein LOC109166969 [Ipomoea nil]